MPSVVKTISGVTNPKVSELGGKGYSLAVLAANRFCVPGGFIVTTDAFFTCLRECDLVESVKTLTSEIREPDARQKCAQMKRLLLGATMSEEMVLEIGGHLRLLDGVGVSVRSSAASEDSQRASFAGLHDTFLDVNPNLQAVLDKVRECWASLYNERAVIYRLRKGIPLLEGMAVVVQEMVPAECSGITFTVHPLNKNALLIEASYGLGDLIVSGKVQPDSFSVDRETLVIVERRLGHKNRMSICKSGGTEVVETRQELVAAQVMPDEMIRETAKTCMKIEETFGRPQDVEWCVSSNRMWLLQSRPVAQGLD